jgi:hypothetical protein
MPCSWMRHANSSNSNITMNIYTHAVSSKKRRAQSKVVGNDSTSGKSDTSFGGPGRFGSLSKNGSEQEFVEAQ